MSQHHRRMVGVTNPGNPGWAMVRHKRCMFLGDKLVSIFSPGAARVRRLISPPVVRPLPEFRIMEGSGNPYPGNFVIRRAAAGATITYWLPRKTS